MANPDKKRKSAKNKKSYTSKGIHSSVDRRILKAIRRETPQSNESYFQSERHGKNYEQVTRDKIVSPYHFTDPIISEALSLYAKYMPYIQWGQVVQAVKMNQRDRLAEWSKRIKDKESAKTQVKNSSALVAQ